MKPRGWVSALTKGGFESFLAPFPCEDAARRRRLCPRKPSADTEPAGTQVSTSSLWNCEW